MKDLRNPTDEGDTYIIEQQNKLEKKKLENFKLTSSANNRTIFGFERTREGSKVHAIKALSSMMPCQLWSNFVGGAAVTCTRLIISLQLVATTDEMICYFPFQEVTLYSEHYSHSGEWCTLGSFLY